jgi:flagellar hook-associated protein 1 FlgK
MATGSIFSIGLTGLNAAQAGLATTSHNIANVSTPGYHRQNIVQSSNTPLKSGSGFFGQGTTVDTVLRSYSQFLDRQVLSAQTTSSYLDAYQAQVSQIDNMLADPSAGLSPALQDFFSGVQDVGANPASVPSRQQMISLAQTMVARFQALDSRIAEMRSGVNSQLRDVVTNINTLSAKIAEVNQQIIYAQANPTQPANDLYDKRDLLVSDLNKLVKANVVQQSDGTINVSIGNGQSLVVGVQSQTLAAVPSLDDPQDWVVALNAGANSIVIPPGLLQGGQIGALLDFRSQSLDPTQNRLGRVATVLAQTFNDQHNLGIDLNGNIGGNFFTVPSAQVIVRSSNTGSAVIAAANTTMASLTDSDYRLTYSGVTYSITRLSDSLVSGPFATLPQTIDGVAISLTSGTPNAGDSFLIQPTRYGARDIAVAVNDTSLIAAAAPIRTLTGGANTGSAKISEGVAVNTSNAAFVTPGALTPPILIRFTSAAQYSVFDNTNPAAPVLLEANIAYNPAVNNAVFPTPGALDYGYRVNLTGVAATNDTFNVNFNSNGVADNRNALLMASLQTRNTIAGGTANYQGAYSQIVSAVGNKAREVQVQGAAQDALVKHTSDAQQALSGVNLDEEAANLIRYQQAYQASGKVLQIATKLFEDLLALGQ